MTPAALTRKRARFVRIYRERIARGDCRLCGKNPAAPDKKLCGGCAESERERMGEIRDSRAPLNLCYACGEALGETTHQSRCTDCAEDVRRRVKDKYAARKAAGLCVYCGAPKQSDFIACTPCGNVRKKRSADRYAKIRKQPTEK